MGARLLYRDSRGRDGQVALSPDTPCYVGRALDCAIRTDDAMVSRKHSMIRMEGGSYYVEDLGSSNGTHVNNQRVSKYRLSHNDVVRCGSLLLRYVEDGPLVSAGGPQQPAGQSPVPAAAAPGQGPAGYGGSAGAGGYPGAAPGGQGWQQPGQAQGAGGYAGQGAAQPATPQQGKRGTQRLDVGPGQSASPYPSQVSSPSSGPVSGPPSSPNLQGQSGIFGGSAAQGPYGGPPPMPRDAGPAFGPPDMPADANPFGAPAGAGSAAAGTPPAAHNPFARPEERERNSDTFDESLDKLTKDLEDTRKQLDELQSNYDREVADGKRLRAESATLRDRIQQLNETIGDRDEQIKAHQSVAEELRRELAQSRDERAQAQAAMAEMAESMHAKERQVGRMQDDIAKLKDEKDELARQLTEVSKTKDEGWKKLNEQLGEIEHLREVINEQERMLEERKVGLVSQEVALKELRADKEAQIKVQAQLKAERDELQADLRRQQAQLQTVEEENRRLSRLLSEAQSGGQGATVGLTDELREVRVELKKLEADCDRYQEMYERAASEAQQLEERVAELDQSLREANDRKAAVTSTQSVIEESLAKAEAARHKAAEDALLASKERDEAVAAAEKARHEAERLKRRIEELEQAGQQGRDDAEMRAENEALKRKLELAETHVAELERSLGEIRTELDLARAQAEEPQQAGPAPAAEAPSGDGTAEAIRNKAVEVYENVNDVLSEIRNNLRLVHGDFSGLAGERDDEPVRIIYETLQTLIDNAEDAKGVVRGLRELAEFG